MQYQGMYHSLSFELASFAPVGDVGARSSSGSSCALLGFRLESRLPVPAHAEPLGELNPRVSLTRGRCHKDLEPELKLVDLIRRQHLQKRLVERQDYPHSTPLPSPARTDEGSVSSPPPKSTNSSDRSPYNLLETSLPQTTLDPNTITAEVHNRMPVILHAKDYERWLDRSNMEQPPSICCGLMKRRR